MTFSEPAAELAPGAAPVALPPISPQKLLEDLQKTAQHADDQGARTLEAAWCGLIDQLEERKVFSRDELLASLRTIREKFGSSQEI